MLDFQQKYRNTRMMHWNRMSAHKKDPKRAGHYYQELLAHHYRQMIPPGKCVLEVGCGHGQLLASVKPIYGVGIDFSEQMLRVAQNRYQDLFFVLADAHNLPLRFKFDFIILSDIVNDLADVQQVLENLNQLCHSKTRIICNFYSNLWRIPLKAVKHLGLGADVLEQNWLTLDDFRNLLSLTDFEIVSRRASILLPVEVPYVSTFVNRYLAPMWPFSLFCLTNFFVARSRSKEASKDTDTAPSVSVIVPARNEAGNIDAIIRRIPVMGSHTEIVFVEGNSKDQTYDVIEQKINEMPQMNIRLYRQNGVGKGDAVRLGFKEAKCDILMILDADMTVPPEDLPRFYDVLASGKGEFVNGVRLVYPMEDRAMRFANMLGNKFFSIAFTWLLGQPIKDTLCGTKVMWKTDYNVVAENRGYFGNFDPFGDFDLLFGAARLNFKIKEIPIRYRSRTYGDTNIQRWKHGWLLIKMVVFAARRIKFI